MAEKFHENTPPTNEEILEAASVLSKLQPGFLPRPLFEQVTRLWVTPIVELVPLRTTTSGETEVLLLQRPDDDPNWPGMLHTPGTVLLATDDANGIDSAIHRIANEELLVDTSISPTFVGPYFHRVKRGTELASVYFADLSGLQTEGDWYPAGNLPDNIVETQIGFIQEAIIKFNDRI